MFVLAQSANSGYIVSIVDGATVILRRALIFLMALAVVWFIWNVIKYTMSEDEGEKEKAKGQMIWGVIAIAVSISVWGLVALLQVAFGLNEGASQFQGSLGNMIPHI